MSSPPGFGSGLPPKKRRTTISSEPRKRVRTESVAKTRPRKHAVEGHYCDDYRLLFNQVVQQAAARFETDAASRQYYAWQIGASLWSSDEQAIFYAALERLGKDNLPGIADAIGTKSIPETRALILLLEDAAAKQGDVQVTLHDIPAAMEVGEKCSEQLELAADALAWNQERYEARQEREQYGDYWLITPALGQEIEAAIDADPLLRDPTAPVASEPASPSKRGETATGACLSCKKTKQKCDGKIPCSNCQKLTNRNCEYTDPPNKAGQTEASEQPSHPEKPKDIPAKTDILEVLPEAILLRPQVMLRLSKNVFMNRSTTPSSPWPHWSAYTSDIAQEPSIYRTAFGDLYNLVVSLTRRLIQTAIIQAAMRLRAGDHKTPKPATPAVRKSDVLTAIDILGMQRNARHRWSGVARRCALRVYEYERSAGRERQVRREMSLDEFERTMALVDQTADSLDIDTKPPSNYVEPRSEAAWSTAPLPLEDLALSDSDDSMIDETGPAAQRQLHSQDLTGMQMEPSVVEDSKIPIPELVSLEQFDREASRQEEEKLWTMLGLELPEDDGDKNDDEYDSSQDETTATLPDGWRQWTDYHSEWEEFDTPPDPAKFMANRKSLTVPVLHEHTTKPVDSDFHNLGASKQKQKQRQKEPEVRELQTLSSRAYADRLAQALTQVESTSATSSEDENINNEESDDEGMNQSTLSVDTEGRSSSLGVADDEDMSMVSEPTAAIDSRSKTRPAAYTDDEMSEMDWNSFID